MTAIKKEQLTGYAKSDWDAVDYRMWKIADDVPALRGPEINISSGKYIAVLGAAQTFGRFVEQPYPQILSERLGIPFLNLGFAGAGPKMYLRPPLLKLINEAAAVIIQVFSGRSLGNSVFECPNDGGQLRRRDRGVEARPVFALDAWREWMDETRKNQPDEAAYRAKVRALVEETRTLWLGEMVRLRHAIKPPCTLFWMSKRSLDYVEQYSYPELLFGEFPQFVNREMIESIQPLFQEFVESVSEKGSPQPLINRFSRAPFTIDPLFRFPNHNVYYPSPEMHEDAANALVSHLEKFKF